MSSLTPDPESTDTLERLLARARSIVERLRKSDHLLDCWGNTASSRHAEIEYLRETVTTTPQLPDELVEALRSPAGRQEIVNLHVGGKAVQVVVPCQGQADVHVEQEVWRVILSTALGGDR